MGTQSKQAKTSGKGLNKKKGKRQTRLKTYYQVQFYRTEANKLKKLRRHLKRFVRDLQGLARYKEMGGK